MTLDRTIAGTEVTYENPWQDELGETEKEAYETAAQEAEDALAAIVMLQERRIDSQGSLREPLMGDEFRKLRDEMNRLEEAIDTLEFIGEFAGWGRREMAIKEFADGTLDEEDVRR